MKKHYHKVEKYFEPEIVEVDINPNIIMHKGQTSTSSSSSANRNFKMGTSHKKINSGYTANYNNNNDMFSEKIKMPKRDSFNHNQKINTNNLNVGGDDIISNKSSLGNFEIKI